MGKHNLVWWHNFITVYYYNFPVGIKYTGNNYLIQFCPFNPPKLRLQLRTTTLLVPLQI